MKARPTRERMTFSVKIVKKTTQKQDEVVGPRFVVERISEDRRRLHRQTNVAVGHALPVNEYEIQDELRGEGRDDEIKAPNPQRGQAESDADHGRGDARERNRDVEGQPQMDLGQRHRIGAHAHERRMAERQQAGIARS